MTPNDIAIDLKLLRCDGIAETQMLRSDRHHISQEDYHISRDVFIRAFCRKKMRFSLDQWICYQHYRNA